MIKTVSNNTELLKILSDRPDVLSTAISNEGPFAYSIQNTELDDSDLCIYENFVQWYSHLSQLDKDIFYLLSQLPVAEIARLLECSVGFVYNKKRELEQSRKNSKYV